MIDFEPSEEQQLVVDTVRQFAQNEIRPHSRSAAEARELPKDVLNHAHELGLVANALDSGFGGGGERSAVTSVLVAEELAWGDLSVALAILSPALTALPVQDLGDDAQKSEWLPRFTGDAFVPGSMAVVEPRFDADPLRPATRAVRDGDGYALTGRKCFVPWIEATPGCVVLAAGDDGGLAAFLVPSDAPGLSVERERNMGLDALPTVELALDGVRVPASARLAGAPGALLTRGRVALAAAAVGVARAAYELSREYAKQREAFGAPIATKQAIAFKLADMAIEIDAARLLAWEAAWLLDEGRDADRAAVWAMQQASRVALQVTDGAVQVLGGHGYTREYLPELHLRNARGFASFEALALL